MRFNRWSLTIVILSVASFVLQAETLNSQNTANYTDAVAKFYGLQSNQHLKMLSISGYQQTQDYTCGPAAAMSLLHYYGKLSDKDMNPVTELKIAKEMGTSVERGTSEKQMVVWLNAHGFNATLGYYGSLALLQKNLDQGIPTLVDWIDWGGHWVAVAGYNKVGVTPEENKDTIFFTDPAVSSDNVRSMNGLSSVNPARFNAMWFNSGLVKGIYIIAVPKKGE